MSTPAKRRGHAADRDATARPMGEFVQYVKPDSNIAKYYDEFENAGPEERAELLRCRSIDRRCEYMIDGFGPNYDENDYEMEG